MALPGDKQPARLAVRYVLTNKTGGALHYIAVVNNQTAYPPVGAKVLLEYGSDAAKAEFIVLAHVWSYEGGDAVVDVMLGRAPRGGQRVS